ncbi:MAG: hypothetical protein IKP28_05545 [Clostridia bacterium]|nr:hypothetical protein [Clostridia bacterium]
MKKKTVLIIGLVLILTIGLFALTGCGEEKAETATKASTSTSSSSGSIQGSEQKGDGLDNVTESNYAKLMKENYGIDPIYGDGWTIKEVKSPNKTNNLRVNYTTPKDIDKEEWTKKYFDATLAISTDGIYAMEMDFNTGALSKGEKCADYEKYSEGGYSGWYYYWDGKQIQVNCSIYPGDALITFTFTK